MRREEPSERANYFFERVDILVLIEAQLGMDPFACVGQTRSQIHDHHSV